MKNPFKIDFVYVSRTKIKLTDTGCKRFQQKMCILEVANCGLHDGFLQTDFEGGGHISAKEVFFSRREIQVRFLLGSFLSVISKLFEAMINKKVLEHLNKTQNKLIKNNVVFILLGPLLMS